MIGAEIEPWTTYREQGTLTFIVESLAQPARALPLLGRVAILRTWAGLCDVTPDYSPIIGRHRLRGLLSRGWGTYGFKAAPIVGVMIAD